MPSDFAEPHIGLANALGDKDRVYEAIGEFREAWRINPNLAYVYNLKEDAQIIEALKNAHQTILQGKKEAKISGGDGFSLSNAIIISECNNAEGIVQEYIELGKRFGQYKQISRRLIKDKNNFYDLYELDINGEKVKVYFDVTNFMGIL